MFLRKKNVIPSYTRFAAHDFRAEVVVHRGDWVPRTTSWRLSKTFMQRWRFRNLSADPAAARRPGCPSAGNREKKMLVPKNKSRKLLWWTNREMLAWWLKLLRKFWYKKSLDNFTGKQNREIVSTKKKLENYNAKMVNQSRNAQWPKLLRKCWYKKL